MTKKPKPNKRLMIATALLVLVLIGGLYYFKFMNSGYPLPGTGDSFSGSFKNILLRNIPSQCSYDYNDPEIGKSTGMMYIVGVKKMRGDFKITLGDGKITNSSMIRNGNVMYSWSTDSNEGTKITITEEQKKAITESLSSDPQSDNIGDLASQFENEKINYNCKPWLVNESMFNPPENIKFNDLSEMINKVPTTPSTDVKPECSVCDQAPDDESRAQCRQGLGC